MASDTSNQVDAAGKVYHCDIPAIIKWDDSQPRGVGASLASTPVSLDIDLDPSSTTASIRLRIALLQRGSDSPVPLFLVIGSPHIQSFTVDSPDHATYGTARQDGNVTCLRFELSSHPTLVVPPEPLRLKDKSQLTIMRSLRWAARQSLLMVYIQDGVLSVQQLTLLREALYSNYTSSPRHTDIGRLYGGRGGKVLDAGSDDGLAGNAPPLYDDVPAPPPEAPISDGMFDRLRLCPPGFVRLTILEGSDTATSSKKRRRVDSPAAEFNISMIEKLCRQIADEQHERTRAELSSMESRLIQRLDQGMDDRVHSLEEAWKDKFHKLEGQIQELRRDFEAKTQELINETDALDDTCQGEIQRLDEWIQEVSDDIDRRVDFEVEDRVLGIKVDLEEFVQDELSSTEDTLKQRISEASVYIEFKE